LFIHMFEAIGIKKQIPLLLSWQNAASKFSLSSDLRLLYNKWNQRHRYSLFLSLRSKAFESPFVWISVAFQKVEEAH
jgi:hypothetical protein